MPTVNQALNGLIHHVSGNSPNACQKLFGVEKQLYFHRPESALGRNVVLHQSFGTNSHSLLPLMMLAGTNCHRSQTSDCHWITILLFDLNYCLYVYPKYSFTGFFLSVDVFQLLNMKTTVRKSIGMFFFFSTVGQISRA